MMNLPAGLPVRLRLERRQTGIGSQVERLFFGDLPIPADEPPYEDFLQSLAHCLGRTLSGWNPHEPPDNVLGFALRYWVVRNWPRRDKRSLGLYVGLGMSFDFWHGVDGLLYRGSPDDPDWDHRQRRVTFDIAAYDKERQDGKRVKADLLLIPENFGERGDIRRIGRTIARYLTGEISLRAMQQEAHRWM